MNKIARAFIILIILVLVCPALGQADIVYIKDDDKLFGTIQSPSFSMQTPYGKIRIETEFLKSIRFKDGNPGRCVIETINNDHFSGSLLEDSIRFMQEDGSQKIIKKEQIIRMQRDIVGSSRQVRTTIFTMKNDDRFSGKFLNTRLEIVMNYMTKSIQAAKINRIEFMEDYQTNTKILLENGDLIEGALKQNQFRLMPDAVSGLTVTQSNLKSIQFNAPKLVLKEFSGDLQAEKDSDGDGISDYADILFDFNRFDLKPQFYPLLDEVVVRLEQNPNLKVEIQGHTDSLGSERYNQNLSENRARAVKNYFVSKGIKGERLFPVGFGFKIKKVPNETEAGRALNRRVEFAIRN